MKIVNCFPYYNEIELLELRLRLLGSVVDSFIICEADHTHTGTPKPFTVEEDLKRLGLWSDKITVHKVKLPVTENRYKDNRYREYLQRDAASDLFEDDDVVFVTDADEIIDAKYVRYYAQSALKYSESIIGIPMVFLNCRADLQIVNPDGSPKQWSASYVCLKHHAKRYTLSQLRESHTTGIPQISFNRIYLTDNGVIQNAGWHFSWMGDRERMLEKWNSYSEYGNVYLGDPNAIQDRISKYDPNVKSPDVLGREDHIGAFYHWNNLPSVVFNHEHLKQFLLPGTKIDHFYFKPQMGENWFTFPNLYRKMVQTFPAGSTFVEVGVWKGRSAAFMCTEIANSGKNIDFYCVDHWEGSIEHRASNKLELKGLYEIYTQNMLPVKGLYKDLKMGSREAAKEFKDKSIDFCFIDASHLYEEVKADIAAWLPKMKNGGIMAGHDCYPNNPEFGGVYRALQELIPGQFEVSEDCWIWKIGTETSYPLDSIDGRLNTYIRNPDNPDNNFSLALEYDSQGQKASAISYYLRAAERTNSVMFQYECLIKAAAAFDVLGMRALSVRGLLEKAIIIAPRRPEAYYLLSRWYERLRTVEGWMQSYLTACLGIEFSEKTAYKFRTNIDYPGFYGLLFEKAVSGWWMGQCEEACNIFIELHKSSQLDHSHRTAVISNLKQLGQFHTKNIRQYKSEYHSRLKFVFPGSDSIAQNFSESYQDMFVLSVLKGKRNGTFLEIGSANPFYGNNTALLEKNFGWTGIAIDLDKALAAEYNSARSTKCHNINALEIDYEKLLQEQNAPEVIDYLQIDIDPADVSLQCLKKIPFSTRKFNVITFEHDGYTQVDHKITNESRMILSSNGYTPLVRNVAPDDWRYYEDWWIRNELLDSIPSEMKDNSEGVKSAESYMLKP